MQRGHSGGRTTRKEWGCTWRESGSEASHWRSFLEESRTQSRPHSLGLCSVPLTR